MNITIPLLLLLVFVVLYWLLKESKLKLWLKILGIILSFSFCAIFYTAASTLLGWAAGESALPKDGLITIRHITIKEPNPAFNIRGGIFLLLEYPPPKYDSIILQTFGYKSEGTSEPRLIKLKYSRKLHEELEKSGAMARLQNGQLIMGKLTKGGNPPKGKDSKDEKGDGDESQEDFEYHFYNLQPSYFQPKPPR